MSGRYCHPRRYQPTASSIGEVIDYQRLLLKHLYTTAPVGVVNLMLINREFFNHVGVSVCRGFAV